MTHRDAASSSGEDRLATSIPLKAATVMHSIHYTSKDTDASMKDKKTVREGERESAAYLMTTLGSCVALQFRVAVVPLMTRWSTGGTEITVRPVEYQHKGRGKMNVGKRQGIQ